MTVHAATSKDYLQSKAGDAYMALQISSLTEDEAEQLIFQIRRRSPNVHGRLYSHDVKPAFQPAATFRVEVGALGGIWADAGNTISVAEVQSRLDRPGLSQEDVKVLRLYVDFLSWLKLGKDTPHSERCANELSAVLDRDCCEVVRVLRMAEEQLVRRALGTLQASGHRPLSEPWWRARGFDDYFDGVQVID